MGCAVSDEKAVTTRDNDEQAYEPGQRKQTFPDLPTDSYADCKLFPQINLNFPGERAAHTPTSADLCPHTPNRSAVDPRKALHLCGE